MYTHIYNANSYLYIKLKEKNKSNWLVVLTEKGHFYQQETYIVTTWQKLSPATEQLHMTSLVTSAFLILIFGMGGVTQLDLLLHGSMSKFQSFLPSDLAISSRAFSIYAIETYQLSTENSSKLHTHIIKYIYIQNFYICKKIQDI
jgi:hypothetical protein